MSDPIPIPFKLASLELADAIGLHWFGQREQVVLDFIRRQSVGAGRTEAYIPGLKFFAKATRIKEDNLKHILRGLFDQRVIEERPQYFFGFMLPWQNWKAPPRGEQVEVINQLSLLDEPPHLRDAMRHTFVEQCNTPGHTPVATYTRELLSVRPSARAPESGVPNSGTPPISPSRTQIGYDTPSPQLAGVSAVPNLGTPPIGTLKHCKNGTKPIVPNVSLPLSAVPDLGTDAPPIRPPRPRGKKFSVEQQELFDECRRVGAFASDGDPERSRGCWYDMVNRRPETVRWLLSELRAAKVARIIENPGGFMMKLWIESGKPEFGGL